MTKTEIIQKVIHSLILLTLGSIKVKKILQLHYIRGRMELSTLAAHKWATNINKYTAFNIKGI